MSTALSVYAFFSAVQAARSARSALKLDEHVELLHARQVRAQKLGLLHLGGVELGKVGGDRRRRQRGVGLERRAVLLGQLRLDRLLELGERELLVLLVGLLGGAVGLEGGELGARVVERVGGGAVLDLGLRRGAPRDERLRARVVVALVLGLVLQVRLLVVHEAAEVARLALERGEVVRRVLVRRDAERRGVVLQRLQLAEAVVLRLAGGVLLLERLDQRLRLALQAVELAAALVDALDELVRGGGELLALGLLGLLARQRRLPRLLARAERRADVRRRGVGVLAR
jgi:hypothetical protein